MTNLGIMASTSGTDMQAVIDAIENKHLDAKISVVIVNKKDCYAYERAKKHNLKAVFIDGKDKSRDEFDREAARILDENRVELILLIGYMRYLSGWFTDRYRNRIMNIHPSLLPAFAGGMDRNVHKEVLDHGCKITGCTLHFVDKGADTGPIILQKAVDIGKNETVDSLKIKVQKAEQEIILKAVKLFADKKLSVKGRKVTIL